MRSERKVKHENQPCVHLLVNPSWDEKNEKRREKERVRKTRKTKVKGHRLSGIAPQPSSLGLILRLLVNPCVKWKINDACSSSWIHQVKKKSEKWESEKNEKSNKCQKGIASPQLNSLLYLEHILCLHMNSISSLIHAIIKRCKTRETRWFLNLPTGVW